MGLSRLSRFWVLGFAAAMTVTAADAPASRAEVLPPAECQKLDAERKALMVLGADKYIEKGPDWAKTNLTVADLDLVKRYFDVFEQLKFRCQEDIGIIEVDEPDVVDDDDQQTAAPGSAPPVPERRLKSSGHSSAAAMPEHTGSTTPETGSSTVSVIDSTPALTVTPKTARGNIRAVTESPRTVIDTPSVQIEKSWGANTTSIPKRPRQAPPVQ
jgi:hypothetical protein